MVRAAGVEFEADLPFSGLHQLLLPLHEEFSQLNPAHRDTLNAALVPSQDRPYVDGSPHDSVYTQVFDYNGLGRLTGNRARLAGPPSPLVVAAKENGQLLTADTMGIKPSWHRLLAGPFAADGGWLLPAAAVAALCGTGIAACGPGPWPARVRMIVAATVLGCAGYGAYLVSGTASGPVVLTVVARERCAGPRPPAAVVIGPGAAGAAVTGRRVSVRAAWR